MKMEEGTPASHQKEVLFSEVQNVTLWMHDVGLFIASGHVIACDPRGAILDNKLGEDHLGVSILYCPNNVLKVMTTWKWPLTQTIMDGYSLRQFLVS